MGHALHARAVSQVLVTNWHVLTVGDHDGLRVGLANGEPVGLDEGNVVGARIGLHVGLDDDGDLVGCSVTGECEGCAVSPGCVGANDGRLVGEDVGIIEGDELGLL